MLARLQAARLRLYEKAILKGQLQTAAQVLDSIGKVIGESVEHVSIQAPEPVSYTHLTLPTKRIV